MIISKLTKECFETAKSGWNLVTKITRDVLTEHTFVKELLFRYGSTVFLRGYIPKNSKNLAIDLNGEIYLAQDFFEQIYRATRKNYLLMIKHLLNLQYQLNNQLLEKAKQIDGFIKKNNLREKPDNELFKIFASFFKYFQKMSPTVDLPFAMEYSLKRLIKENLIHLSSGESDKLINSYGFSGKETELTQERKDFKKLLLKIRRDKKLAEIFLDNNITKIRGYLKSDYPKFYQKIKGHTGKYAFGGMMFFVGKPHRIEFFISRLKEYLKQKEILSNKRNVKSLPSWIKKDEKIYKLITFLQETSYVRNWRLETINKSICYIYPLLEELAFRMKLKYQEMICLNFDEIKKLFFYPQNKKSFKRLIQQRKKGFGIVYDKKFRVYVIAGKELEFARQYFHKKVLKYKKKLMDELKGISAQPGLVRGEVVVIRSANEFKKFKKNNILVTQMTTPDFVPILEKAAALITDIGGITCHAAIVSREMNKPCVIGTKIATKVLKDGDMVEVDANRGIVKIIKKIK